jgi:hypothetical protein
VNIKGDEMASGSRGYISEKVNEVLSHLNEIRKIAFGENKNERKCCKYWLNQDEFVEDRLCNVISIMGQRGGGVCLQAK